MDAVKLMNRTDRKFCFKRELLVELLSELNAHYFVLEIEQKRVAYYQTLYYDTPALGLYYKHHQGKQNRYKIRHRLYVDSKLGFLEVKLKTNKGRTHKTRIEKKEVSHILNSENGEFISRESNLNAQELVPVLWVNYERITLVNKKDEERLTLDVNLQFIKDNNTKSMAEMVIAEVKQDRKKESPFISLAQKCKLPEGGISKFCLGLTQTTPQLKYNNFKPAIQKLSKQIYDDKYYLTSH